MPLPQTLLLGLGPAVIELHLTKTQQDQLTRAKEATSLEFEKLTVVTKDVMFFAPERASRSASKPEKTDTRQPDRGPRRKPEPDLRSADAS